MVAWETPFFGCFSTFSLCLLALLPGGYCLVQGLAVSKARNKGCVMATVLPLLCCCIGAAVNRSRLRDRYLISGSGLGDACVHLMCPICAVVQEYREVEYRSKLYRFSQV